MTVSRTGSLILPLDNCCKLFADSATFRELMEVATPTLAYAKCWLGDTDDTDATQVLRPRTIVSYTNGQFEFKKETTTSGVRTGPIDVAIEVPCPTAYLATPQDAYLWLLSKIGAVIDEIFVLSSNGSVATLNSPLSHLNVIGIEVDMIGPADMTTENGTKVLGALLVINWRGM
jgi:hypothetical protein